MVSCRPLVVSRSDVRANLFTGSIPALPAKAQYSLFLRENFFTGFSPGFLSSVCSSHTGSQGDLLVNCLSSQGVDPYGGCASAQARAECNRTCPRPCPGTNVCFIVGDSAVQACPCSATQYVNAILPYPCVAIGEFSFAGSIAGESPRHDTLKHGHVAGMARTRRTAVVSALNARFPLLSFPDLFLC